ncbi:MAG: hypothetical protein OXT69_00915 [Candidatus Poribacteria bacterium]|nr:hypothetical protein [Candidatus Poribacteria bacterium]
MRHLNEIVRSLMIPPRESRLRKAALTLLAAATAAVFVCAPAGAAVPGQRPLIDPPQIFRITSIGPYLSGYDTFEGVIQGMLRQNQRELRHRRLVRQ